VKLSFKYRFILSFVLLEAFFIVLIVLANTTFIAESSREYVENKIEMMSKMLSQLLITPMSVYDLATIDNTLEQITISDLKAVKVSDSHGRMLGEFSREGMPNVQTALLHKSIPVVAEGVSVGTIDVWFDHRPLQEAISQNQQRNYWFIAAGLLLSTVVAWLVGYKLSRRLERLSQAARDIEENRPVVIEPGNSKDEVDMLARSMAKMQETIRKRTESLEASRYELQHYADIIDNYVSISRTDPDGKITYVSSAFCDIIGFSKEEMLGNTHKMLRHSDVSDAIYEEMWTTIKSGKVWSSELKNLTKDGEDYWVETTISPDLDHDGNVTGYYAIRHNITDKKKIQRLANTDSLTKVYNRLRLDHELQRFISMARRYHMKFCLIMIDLDEFKATNDRYGHLVGDQVLVGIAEILRKNLRVTDIVGRWGGEEFLVLAPHTEAEQGRVLAEKLRRAIEQHRFEAVGQKSASFGVTLFREDDDATSLVKRADEALYQAKEKGRNRVCAL
jgi:diguanylate cyclase (GGDEF)-like protein/PAS domain S-box-containing protein